MPQPLWPPLHVYKMRRKIGRFTKVRHLPDLQHNSARCCEVPHTNAGQGGGSRRRRSLIQKVAWTWKNKAVASFFSAVERPRASRAHQRRLQSSLEAHSGQEADAAVRELEEERSRAQV
jgi:hypothetical protein